MTTAETKQLEIFATALSHPLRLQILKNVTAAARQDILLNLSDAVRPYKPTRSSISMHIEQLVEAGFLSRQKVGKHVFVSLRKQAVEQMLRYLEQLIY